MKKDLEKGLKSLALDAWMIGYKRALNDRIRCKNCKYFHHSGECILFKPRLNVEDKGGEGFCAWAEMKEE